MQKGAQDTLGTGADQNATANTNMQNALNSASTPLLVPGSPASLQAYVHVISQSSLTHNPQDPDNPNSTTSTSETDEPGSTSGTSGTSGTLATSGTDTVKPLTSLILSAVKGGGGGGVLQKIKGNPYMQPSIMALLAPVLSGLSQLYNKITMQSSKLQQAMMALTLSMAKEIYGYDIESGDAQVAQLQMDVVNDMGAIAGAGIQLVGAGIQMHESGMFDEMLGKEKTPAEADYNNFSSNVSKYNELKTKNEGKDMPLTLEEDDTFTTLQTKQKEGKTLTPEEQKTFEKLSEKKAKAADFFTESDEKNLTKLDTQQKNSDIIAEIQRKNLNGEQLTDKENVQSMDPAIQNAKPLNQHQKDYLKTLQDRKQTKMSEEDYNSFNELKESGVPDSKKAQDTKIAEKGNKASAEAQSKAQNAQLWGTIFNAFGQIVSKMVEAGTTMGKIPAVLAGAMAQAMKDMLTQLMSLIQNTISTGQQDQQAASKGMQDIADLFKSFAQTIAQSMYSQV
ncbi:MAG: hypothetical protein JSR46_12135 [Verrucomicrobia bacterium]|nr:hypothetical protein [Verrucomicrobiota bacterium]